jgi:type 1 fimbria pilin
MNRRAVMMKKRCLCWGFALVWTCAWAHDGRVYVTGTITDNTCTLSPDSENIQVDMGTVSNRQFYQAGDGGGWQPFAITLQNCGSTASGVTVSFSGVSDAQRGDLFALDEGADAASGIGIALYDKNKQQIAPGAQSDVQALVAGVASERLAFYARYVADGGAVAPGIANASATFVLNYE